jgi:ring-1,2-phenylacetyl-CoA epoxidase subunit PaaC
MSISKLNYVLQLADNALILGHRISEWTGHGPVLEQDIAITNTALDHLGQARSWYQYAATLYNALPTLDKTNALTLPDYINIQEDIDEDVLAFLRDAWDYKNVLLVEQPNEDWAYTIARSFFYDHYAVLLYTQLQNSNDATLAAIAEKSLKEALYHKRWSSEWVIRLGDGTEESKQRMQEAIDNRWSFVGEMFIPSEADQTVAMAQEAPLCTSLREVWYQGIQAVLEEATLTTPPLDTWMQQGGKQGQHTEHLGYLLAEMQYMQRAYPNMKW